MRRLIVLAAVLSGCAAAASPSSPQQPSVPASPIAATITATASPTPTAPPRRITVSGSGDILIHPSLWAHAQVDGVTFDQELAGVRPAVRGTDYSICHVEQGFNDPSGPVTEYPNYYTHPVLAQAIADTGFDACSTASNWTWLKGLDGVARTNRALRSAGVPPAGSRATESGPIATVQDVAGVSVAHVSATDPVDSPGIAGAEWAINRATPRQIVEQAREVRAQGAEIVVVSLAMGQMGATTTDEAQREAIRTIARSGQVDLVIGHGAHVIQGAERINGMWSIWHGNILTSFFPDQRRMHEGLVSQVTFTEQPDGRFLASRARGEIVLSLPQTGRLIDISRHRCSTVPERWQEAYDAGRQALSTGIEQGFELARPCDPPRR